MQVVGLTNYSHWKEAGPVRQCLQNFPTTQQLLSSLALKHLQRFVHVGVMDMLDESIEALAVRPSLTWHLYVVTCLLMNAQVLCQQSTQSAYSCPDRPVHDSSVSWGLVIVLTILRQILQSCVYDIVLLGRKEAVKAFTGRPCHRSAASIQHQQLIVTGLKLKSPFTTTSRWNCL